MAIFDSAIFDSALFDTGAVAGISGEMSGSLSLSGTSAGGVAIAGVASGSLTLTGSASGAVLIQGTESGSITLTGAATGKAYVAGVASGSITLSGSATGTAASGAAITGEMAGSLSLTGAATGAVLVQGTESGSITLTGSASGVVAIAGQAAGSLTLTGAASGNVLIAGQAAGSLALSGSAEGAGDNPNPAPIILRGDDVGEFSRERFWRKRAEDWIEDHLEALQEANGRPQRARKRLASRIIADVPAFVSAIPEFAPRVDALAALAERIATPAPDYTALAAAMAREAEIIAEWQKQKRRRRDVEALLMLAA